MACEISLTHSTLEYTDENIWNTLDYYLSRLIKLYDFSENEMELLQVMVLPTESFIPANGSIQVPMHVAEKPFL